jgi:hypothetical protein
MIRIFPETVTELETLLDMHHEGELSFLGNYQVIGLERRPVAGGNTSGNTVTLYTGGTPPPPGAGPGGSSVSLTRATAARDA